MQIKMKIIFTSVLCLIVAGRISGQNNPEAKPQAFNQKMKEYSLLVRVPAAYTTEQAKAMTPKWNALLDKWKSEQVYVISFAFPGAGYQVSGPDKDVSEGSVVSDGLRVVSNLFVRAVDIEGAVNLAKSVPVLQAGGTVEIREVPQRPDSIPPR